MSKLEVLRKLIREEVRAAIKEEIVPILKENVISPKNAPTKSYSNSLKEELTKSKKIKVNSTGDPLMDLLNETKMGMTGDDYRTVFNGDSAMAQGFPSMMNNPVSQTQVVESVGQMLNSSRPSTDVTQVQIDAVPDFSALMKNMQSKGQI
jgi:hypothetical protein